jgi:hypothetical protein
MLRKEQYRLLTIAKDECASASVRGQAQSGAHRLSLEILSTAQAVKKLVEERQTW